MQTVYCCCHSLTCDALPCSHSSTQAAVSQPVAMGETGGKCHSRSEFAVECSADDIDSTLSLLPHCIHPSIATSLLPPIHSQPRHPSQETTDDSIVSGRLDLDHTHSGCRGDRVHTRQT